MKRLVVLALFAVVAVTVPVGCASTSWSRSAQQYTDDSVITAKINAEIGQDPIFNTLEVEIEVWTYKGTVTLSGTVWDRPQYYRVVEIAKSVPGVKAVHNNVVIPDEIR